MSSSLNYIKINLHHICWHNPITLKLEMPTSPLYLFLDQTEHNSMWFSVETSNQKLGREVAFPWAQWHLDSCLYIGFVRVWAVTCWNMRYLWTARCKVESCWGLLYVESFFLFLLSWRRCYVNNKGMRSMQLEGQKTETPNLGAAFRDTAVNELRSLYSWTLMELLANSVVGRDDESLMREVYFWQVCTQLYTWGGI